MARLSLFLPSFAADYSGVCSCLFDLDALVVVADAACCTRNYIDYDEPRWSRGKTTALCAQLRTMDVILGDEAKTVAKVVAAARELKPRAIALLGSPVPAITGMDLRGMALEIEAATGVPALGFATTGFATYERGIDLTHRGLIEKFGSGAGDAATNARPQPTAQPRPAVNVLGLTPLDYGAGENAADLRACLEGAGFAVNGSWCMGLTLDDVARVSHADANLVVSAGALGAAEELERTLGIPYVVGAPCAGPQRDLVLEALRRAVAEGVSSYAFAPDGECATGGEIAPAHAHRAEESAVASTLRAARAAVDGTHGAALIVGDWVCAASVRSALRLSGWHGLIVVASLFGPCPRFAEPGDRALSGDRDLADLVASGGFSVVVGDPLLERVPGVSATRHIRMTHPAVSSNLFPDEVPRYFADDIVRSFG